GRNDMDPRSGVEGLAATAPAMEAGGDIEIPLGIDAHAVAAAAGIKVVDEPFAGDTAVGQKIKGSNAASAVFSAVGVDEVEDFVVRRRGQTVGHVDGRRGENARQFAVRIDAIDAVDATGHG